MGYFSYLFYYNWSYLAFMLPCILITLLCQIMVKSAYSKYSGVRNSRNMTGAQAAEYVLMRNNVTDVRIEAIRGNLSDHYDPSSKVIRLSEGVYNATTVSAVGIAAHEAGHAVQHAQNYVPNKIRTAIVPIARIGSQIGWILIFIGLFVSMAGQTFLDIGIFLFSFSTLFTLVTLPVEFNASSRALKCIRENDLLSGEEYSGAKRVLQAAALTYVAAALTSIMQLLRILLIASNRRR